MGIKDTVSAARVLFDCMILEKPDFARIAHTPSKTKLLSPENDPFFPTAEPEEAGLDGEKLLTFLKEASETKIGNVHSLVVLSHGKCVLEAAKTGYAVNMPHATFSMCKTLTGIAVGILIDEGKLSLSSPVISFFPEYKTQLARTKHGQLRIFHLLEMSTGNPFNEAGVVASENYLQSYFETPLRTEPGSIFAYNSMNSYILSSIVTRVAGCSLTEFLTERIFAPLAITNHFWELSSEGVEKGGWGLYLSTRAMAKIGQLFINRGVWEGKRIISEDFLDLMTKKHMSVPASVGVFNYGYHIWCHKKNGGILLNGMLGQNVWILPERELVVAITAGDDCIFQDSPPLISAMRHLRTGAPRDTEAAKAERQYLIEHFGEKASLTPPYISEESREAEETLLPLLLEKTFVADKNNSGILPLMVRLVQNNPSKGIGTFTLQKGEAENTLVFAFTEGRSIYRIKAANTRFLASAHRVHGEPYRFTAAYSFGMNEEREPYLSLEIRFPALASSRRVIFAVSTDGKIVMKMSEKPGYAFVEKLSRTTPTDGNALLGVLTRSKAPVDLALKYAKRAFAPTIALTPASLIKEAKKAQTPQ